MIRTSPKKRHVIVKYQVHMKASTFPLRSFATVLNRMDGASANVFLGRHRKKTGCKASGW